MVEYIVPTNPIAIGIIVLLIIVFGIWLLVLINSSRWLLFQKKKLLACADVSFLRSVILESKELTTSLGNEDLVNISNEMFQKYISIKKLPKNGPVSKHLKAIFEAGFWGTRLDSSELLNLTTQRLFHHNTFLKGVLSLFIVFGLLATLVGLTDSLIQFSGPLQSFTQGTNKQIRSSIGIILFSLRGAFTPSIIGVGLTILGVLLYTVYTKHFCDPVKNLLHELTVTVWIPQLIPTTPVRLIETLRQSEEQMRKSFDAAKKVAEFAEDIQSEVGEFSETLKSSNKVLRKLTDIGNTFLDVATKFEEGSTKLVAFQDDLRTLYTHTLENSSLLRQNVENALNDLRVYNESISSVVNAHGNQLQLVVQTLKTYEDAYLAQRQQIDNALQELFKYLKSTLEQIDTKNKEVIESFGKPLLENLQVVSETLSKELHSIVDQLRKMDEPLKDSANKIENALEVVDKRTTTLKEELQRVFSQREVLITQQIETLNTYLNKIDMVLSGLLQLLSTPVQPIHEGKQGAKVGKTLFDPIFEEEKKKYANGENQFVDKIKKYLSGIFSNNHSNVK